MLLLSLLTAITPLSLLPSAFAATSDFPYLPESQVYFDIYREQESLGRIVVGLFDSKAPKTVRNFIQLATGQNGYGYKNSDIWRIIPHFEVFLGDIQNNDGTGGKSIYGDRFECETKDIPHFKGAVAMNQYGKENNVGSGFYITFQDCQFLNGDTVVFGGVLSGQDVLDVLEKEPFDKDVRPINKIYIKDSGLLKCASNLC